MSSVPTFTSAFLGLLELGAGRMERAAEQLDRTHQLCERFGMWSPCVIQWRADHVEALLRTGRSEEAAAHTHAFSAEAEQLGCRWPLAAAARCRGLIAHDDDFDEPFEAALDLHHERLDPFERGRTQLSYGERLRRAGRASDSREPLRAALETFARLGAEPWARRARSELRASGAAVPPVEDNRTRELTTQEVEVARLVASGATNREAGAALFLSPKTVESHLGRIYRKLGVRSRTELAARLAGDGELAA